jgi:hypothetical protein
MGEVIVAVLKRHRRYSVESGDYAGLKGANQTPVYAAPQYLRPYRKRRAQRHQSRSLARRPPL